MSTCCSPYYVQGHGHVPGVQDANAARGQVVRRLLKDASRVEVKGLKSSGTSDLYHGPGEDRKACCRKCLMLRTLN